MIKRRRDEQINRLHLLALVYLEGLAEPVEVAELQKLIAKSPANRDLFVETATRARMLADSSGLTSLVSGDYDSQPQPAVADRIEPHKPSKVGWVLGVAAAVLIAGLSAGIYFASTTEPAPEPVSPYGRSVAVVLGSHDAMIKNPDGTTDFITDGDSVRTGPFALASGSVEFQTLSGALVRVSAPATLHVLDAGRVELIRGRLAARVSEQAIGFTVETPRFGVIDLGTEFTVSVDDNGVGRVFVYEGLVALRWSSGRTQHVGAGDGGRRVDLDGSVAVINDNEDPSHTSAFATPVGEAIAVAVAPDLIGYYRFDGSGSRDTIRNLAPDAQLGDGVVRGGVFDDVDEIRAMQLDGQEDHVEFRFDQPMPACTFTMRLWIDSLDGNLTGLLMSPRGEGDLHYQIEHPGKLVFHHYGDSRYSFDNVIREQDLKRWVHLTLAYDSAGNAIAVYRDGERLHRQSLHKPAPVKPGLTRLGLWEPLEDARALHGAIAEFTVYDRALSAEEIKRLGTSPLE